MNQNLQQAARLTLSLLLSAAACAQTPAPATPYINRNVIVLDPAHGGQDNGANLGSQPEKDVTLALSASLKALLTARGFTVVSTRESDLPDTAPILTTDQRAGIANHLRPVACIVIHATGTGSVVTLFTSSLPLSPDLYEPAAAVPWETAQTTYLSASQRLANDLGIALLHAKIPAVLTRTSLRPLDNLTCPAIAIEVAPLAGSGGKSTSPTDGYYQQRLADTLAAAIQNWRDLFYPRSAPRSATGTTP